MGFASASAVTARDEHTWEAAIAPGWDVAGNAQGGYLMAIAARAGAEAVGRPDPVSITAHFLSPGRPGPVTVGTEVIRSGRRFGVVRMALGTPERNVLAALGAFTALGNGDAPERVEGRPPDLPPPEECVLLEPTDTFPPPFIGRVELRLHPDDARFRGAPGPPRFTGWLRFPGGETMDTLGLLVAVDAFPPTAFNADLPLAWTPTLELTAHIRARPAPGWLRCGFTTRFITGGFLEEDGEVWDSRGRLVAQSRQLALVPRGARGAARRR
jgi:acyl-coenzyme A thioesterase PaaI-like protein